MLEHLLVFSLIGFAVIGLSVVGFLLTEGLYRFVRWIFGNQPNVLAEVPQLALFEPDAPGERSMPSHCCKLPKADTVEWIGTGFLTQFEDAWVDQDVFEMKRLLERATDAAFTAWIAKTQSGDERKGL